MICTCKSLSMIDSSRCNIILMLGISAHDNPNAGCTVDLNNDNHIVYLLVLDVGLLKWRVIASMIDYCCDLINYKIHTTTSIDWQHTWLIQMTAAECFQLSWVSLLPIVLSNLALAECWVGTYSALNNAAMESTTMSLIFCCINNEGSLYSSSTLRADYKWTLTCHAVVDSELSHTTVPACSMKMLSVNCLGFNVL